MTEFDSYSDDGVSAVIGVQHRGPSSVSVSHVYFMKYSMMGLLHMPNIMSSIEADPFSTYQDILSH